MSSITRRDFVRNAALAAVGTHLTASLLTGAEPSPAVPAPAPAGPPGAPAVHWLDGKAPDIVTGATWGFPWPRGAHAPGAAFALRTAAGAPVPVQTWPLATWPDGSLKWTAHAIPAGAERAPAFELLAGAPAAPATPLTVRDDAEAIAVDTGVIRARMAEDRARADIDRRARRPRDPAQRTPGAPSAGLAGDRARAGAVPGGDRPGPA